MSNAYGNYLTIDDPEALRGLERKERPDDKPHTCPVCDGYGGHILRRDAYGPGIHFKGHCGQCNGWGYVSDESDVACVHDFQHARNLGNCYNLYRCSKCGKERSVDSSG